MEPQVNLHKNEKSDPALPTKLEQKKEDKFSRPAEKYYQRDSIRSDEALLKQAGWKGEPTKQGNKRNLESIRSKNAFAPSKGVIDSYLGDLSD